MSIDQQVRDAGTRLAELPVEVPELDALVRHRHRRRSVAMSGAIVVLLVAVVGSALVVRQPADQLPAGQGEAPADQDGAAASDRRPVTYEPIGLSVDHGLWPAHGGGHPTAEAAAQSFATEVLGWKRSALAVGTGSTGWTMVSVFSGDRSVSMQLEETDEGWRLTSIGDGFAFLGDDSSTALGVGPLPEGTVAMRSWTLVDGSERVTTYDDPSQTLLIDASLDVVPIAVVVFLDADGHAIGAVGGTAPFVPRSARSGIALSDLPTYNLDLDDTRLTSDEVGSPTTLDGAVWVSEDRQTYLTLTARPGSGWVGPTYDGPLTEDTEFPAEEGRAWFTTDDGERVQSLEMWWNRPNDDLWILSMHWPHVADGVPYADARDQLRAWAFAIEQPRVSGEGYTLDLSQTERLAISEHGTISHRARVWEHLEGDIVLSTTDSVASGLSNALRWESTTIVVDDTKGWISVDPRGLEPARVAWPRDDLWFTLQVPHALAGDIDDIVATLERE